MKPKIQPECFIAPSAVIIGKVTVERGCSIWYGAVLRGDENSIFIDCGTNVQDNVILHTTTESKVSVGKNCSIGHGAVVHGCKIHDNVIIGINSTILDHAEIHSGSIIGANALDYSGYPDCRPSFFQAYQRMAQIGTRAGAEDKKPIRVYTPFLRDSKKRIIQKGAVWGVPYQYTWSCYAGGAAPCGRCDSCLLREKGFREADRNDPLRRS